MTIPTIEPQRLTAGDTWQWTRVLADYPASTWTVTYYFVLEGAGTPISFAASADGDTHSVTVAASTTAAYTAGSYHWKAYAVSGTERHEAGSGRMEVLADIATAGSSYDPRSHAQRTLDALESLIEGRASKDVSQYSIGSRQLTKMDPAELRQWRAFYKAEVRREKQEERMKQGLSTSAKIRFRF